MSSENPNKFPAAESLAQKKKRLAEYVEQMTTALRSSDTEWADQLKPLIDKLSEEIKSDPEAIPEIITNPSDSEPAAEEKSEETSQTIRKISTRYDDQAEPYDREKDEAEKAEKRMRARNESMEKIKKDILPQ